MTSFPSNLNNLIDNREKASKSPEKPEKLLTGQTYFKRLKVEKIEQDIKLKLK
jgi:hypothetical protein